MRQNSSPDLTISWAYVVDDSALGESGKAQVFPLCVNVIVARAGGTAYALQGKCAHMASPLFNGDIDVVPAALGDDSVLWGALALAKDITA